MSSTGIVNNVNQNKTLGGVWSEENLYPGLKTNNLRGGLDFSDFPMHDGFGIPEGQHPTGEAMHKYLEAYAQRSDLVRLIDFDTKVTEIAPSDDHKGWILRTSLDAGEYKTKKLIVATGVTNQPHRPTLKGAENFGGPIIHSAELGFKGDTVFNNPSVKTIAVLGGGKSAYDAVHLAGKTGHQIQWIIRKSGKGPEWVFPSHTKMGPFSVPREWLTTRRIISFFSPCLWNDGFGKFRSFLHGTSLGMMIAQKFWANLHVATVEDCGMRKHDATKVLEPETR